MSATRTNRLSSLFHRFATRLRNRGGEARDPKSALARTAAQVVESLEGRTMLSAVSTPITGQATTASSSNYAQYFTPGTIAYDAGSDTVTIHGTSNDDVATITTLLSWGGGVDYRFNLDIHNPDGTVTHVTRTIYDPVAAIVFNGEAGDDEFTNSLSIASTAYGDAGNDTLDGGNGADSIYGGDDDDLITGDDGNDSLFGDDGDDDISGGVGNDSIQGDIGNDSLFGNEGVDTVKGGNDEDLIEGGTSGDSLLGGLGEDSLHGQDGNDTVKGGDQNDHLYGGNGVDTLEGGYGDDVLVSLGGGQSDQLWGEDGYDSFWKDSEATEDVNDASADETADAHIHSVSGFMDIVLPNGTVDTVNRELNSPAINDPALESEEVTAGVTYSDFSSNPLFSSAGPDIDDVDQGLLGDCYFLGTLAGIVNTDGGEDIIRQSVVDLGDGTYAVRFYDGATANYVRVDGDLPLQTNGLLAYARQGAESSIWAPIMEKAWAVFRTGTADYDDIAGGNTTEVADALNLDPDYVGIADWQVIALFTGIDLFDYFDLALSADMVVTFGTIDSGAATVAGNHLYAVEDVFWDNGVQRITVYNPWGQSETYDFDDVYADMAGFTFVTL